MSLTAPVSNGSPPQVRGKRKTNRGSFATFGITPAGAGKTSGFANNVDEARDHPRRCGENAAETPSIRCTNGSPPQVRGKHFALAEISMLVMDHPRRCGENLPSVSEPQIGTGSPPQVRGKLDAIDWQGRRTWITPAGAGKTFCSC